MILVGDIGGTKTVLAVISDKTGIRTPLQETTFLSTSYPHLEAIVQEFMTQHKLPVTRACFGVAGPVINGQAVVTNLQWPAVEAFHLAQTFGFTSVRLLNDLEAIATAIPYLEATDLSIVHPGIAVQHGVLAVIAPGTGLGEAFLTWSGGTYHSHPSEGGNTDFAPTSEQEIGLLRYMQARYDHVSYELVCSGRGIPNIYAYLKASGYADESIVLAQQIAASPDPTPIIVAAALDQTTPEPLCRATLELFISILGAEAGNLALKVMATGGIYLGGGIPPRILSLLDSSSFLQAFQRKGVFRGLMSRIPIYVINNVRTALLGTAYAACM